MSCLDIELLRGLEELSPPGTESLVVELVKLFADSTPSILEELRSALAQGELTSASRLAHRLKGSAANIGAAKMSALCAQLEKSAQTNQPEVNNALVERISASFTASLLELNSYICA